MNGNRLAPDSPSPQVCAGMCHPRRRPGKFALKRFDKFGLQLVGDRDAEGGRERPNQGSLGHTAEHKRRDIDAGVGNPCVSERLLAVLGDLSQVVGSPEDRRALAQVADVAMLAVHERPIRPEQRQRLQSLRSRIGA